jgi:transcriptional regulator of acetoin/glycerol metabolism
MFSMSSGPVLHAIDLPTQLQDFRAHLQAESMASNIEPQGMDASPEVISIVKIEKQAILNTVRQLNGDKLLAAKLLGIGKTTLYRKLKEYGEEC